jgi:PAS domain S-box-containing protein
MIKAIDWRSLVGVPGRGSELSEKAGRGKEILDARFGSFLKLMPLAIAATLLSELGLFLVFSGPLPLGMGLAWLGSAALVSILWLILVRADSRAGKIVRAHPLGRHILFACLTAGIFGAALAYLFPRLYDHEQLMLSIFYIAFISSGVFLTAMVPSVSLAWVSILSAATYAAIALEGGRYIAGSLIGYSLFIAYLILIALAYFRLFRDRFAYQLEAEAKEEELATIFEQSPLSIVLTDLGGNIVQSNRRMEELSGYSKSEYIGRNPRVLKSGKTPQETYEELWGTITKGGIWTGEFINRDKLGREYVEKASISPVRDSDGVIRRYMAIKEDVTLQREYEAELQRQNEIIGLLLRDFEDQSSDWLWELDQELRIAYVPEKLTKLLQGAPIFGRYIGEFMEGWLPREDGEAAELLARLMAALREEKPFKDLEAKVVVGGTDFWIAFSAIPLARPPEGRGGWRGVGRNITDRKLLEIQLSQRANFDELTGLPNRYRFQEALDGELAAASEGYRAILGIMKLGKLDLLRADLGSRTCNAFIDAFIREFRESVGSGLSMARLERDEFAFWASAPDVYQLERIHRFARRLNEPLQIGSDFYQADLHIGLAYYPEDARGRSGLFHAADLALNGAKASATRKVMRYREDLATDFIRRITLVNEFPAALGGGQFRMLYQPQVDAATGALVGAEALIRWEHPRDGTISPGEFVPLAEQSGFITAMGEWSLRRVCGDAMEWEGALKVSVNISGVQLRDSRRLNQAVRRALGESRLPPERLVLEITESSVFGHEDEAVASSLAEFRKLGISIALDDFGTGYSSLAYIQRLHLDELKIDQSFVRELGSGGDAEKIIAIILELARSMSLTTVAEGVEGEAQAAFLRESGCDRLQGYLFGKAMPQGAFRELILKGERI